MRRMPCFCQNAIVLLSYHSLSTREQQQQQQQQQPRVVVVQTSMSSGGRIPLMTDTESNSLALETLYAAHNDNKTAELSQRRPRDAPNISVPWKFLRVLTTHPATFPEICNGLLFRSIIIIIIMIRQFIRRRNMSVRSLQGRRTTGSRDECRTKIRY